MSRCDIVIPVWNQLKSTDACLKSVLQNTHCEYSLIIVDNGSNSKTKQFLEDLRDRIQERRVTLVRNETNQGFVKAANQGIRVSTAEYICLLNNDTIVTSGWLTELMHLASKYPKLGVINPSSNNLGQKISFGKSLEEYAASFASNTGEYVELMSCIGFCMLIKRSLIGEIGVFDEVYGMGNFEDTDFSMRTKEKGYLCVRAQGAYVYHKENTSFKVFGRYPREFEKNRKIFESRWGKAKRVLFAIEDTSEEKNVKLKVKIEKEIKAGNWVFVSSKGDNLIRRLSNHSSLKIYNFNSAFHAIRVFLKILVKKKKFDVIYTDSARLIALAEPFSFVIKANWILL